MRAGDWSIEEHDGTVLVMQGRRPKPSQTSVAQAIAWVGKHVSPGERVFVIEDDGYRLDITRRFQKEMKK